MTHRASSFLRRYFVLLCIPAMVACGSGSDPRPNPGPESSGSGSTESGSDDFPAEMLPAALVPELPLVAPTSDHDIPVFSEIVEVEPGEDVTFCTFTDITLEQARVFGETFGAQSPHGHHALLQYTTDPREPHTVRCSGGEDQMGQLLLGGTAGKEVVDEPTLPENYGMEVPAGAQLVINHHWINTSTETVEAQAMLLARGLEGRDDVVRAGNMVMLGFDWEVPAQAQHSYTTECTFGEDVNYVLAFGHMHEWGSHVTIEVESPDGEVTTMIDDEWTEELATGADASHYYSIEEPYVIHEGDTVRLTCEWDNTTDEPLGWPREMCVFFGNTLGESYFCADGAWLDDAGDVITAMGGSAGPL